MSEFLTTREVAELLRVKERKVYDLASRAKIPCSRATGKLLFPKEEIEQWIEQNQSGQSSTNERPAVMLGSHDPLLEWALRESGCGIASFFDGSLDGIKRFLNNEGIASTLHVYDRESGDWNVPSVQDKLSNSNIALMEWAKRKRGFILSPQCEVPVKHISDLSGCRIVPRQPGAGSQHLLKHLIQEADMEESDFECLEAERTEHEAIMPLLQGKADATLGLASVAHQFNLKFIPILEERMDIVVDRKFWFEPAWQSLLEFCQSATFGRKMAEHAGYDCSDFGRIHFNAR